MKAHVVFCMQHAIQRVEYVKEGHRFVVRFRRRQASLQEIEDAIAPWGFIEELSPEVRFTFGDHHRLMDAIRHHFKEV